MFKAPATTTTTTTTTTSTTTTTTTSTTTTTTTTTTTLPAPPEDGKVSSERRLEELFTVTDDQLQPKSVVSDGFGLFFAQNMMYQHTILVFDSTGSKLATISDEVDLSEWGLEGGLVKGSPVEAAFAPDGEHVYVSNYKIYGSGFRTDAHDDCNQGNWEESFVYRIDTSSYEIDAVIPVGAVPKFLAVSPDGSRLVVSNWCGFDVSIVDTKTNQEVARIDVGRHPRGIAIDSASRTAYIAVMGSSKVVTIDLANNSLGEVRLEAGGTPRHLVLSPDNRYLYVSNNLLNTVRKLDLTTGETIAKVSTGTQPRSMAISDDGLSLYVVNYVSGTVTKVTTEDMKVIQTIKTGYHPVGVTYDYLNRQVWVANYVGSIVVFEDR